MRRLRPRYIAVIVALCVMLVGATVAGASWSGQSGAKGNSTALTANEANSANSANKGNSKIPAHANGRGLSVREGRGPSPVVATTPAITRAPLHAAVHRANPTETSDQRYQWTGVVRLAGKELVLYRGCDRWRLDAQSQEVYEALRGAVDGDRIDVWGRLSRDARHTLEARAAYGANDPRPRILMQDYPCPRDEQPKADFAPAGGHIADINLSSGVIVLRTIDGPARFVVTEDTVIILDGEQVRLSSLAAGMHIRLGYNTATHEAVRIVTVSERPAPQPTVEWASGHIVEIDLSNRVVVLETGDGPMRFHLTRATGVAIDLQRATVLDLEPGMPARIAYDAGTHHALRIMAISNP